MDASEIRHSLDLLVRLIDTTTGLTVEERNVRFWKDDRPVRPIPRGSGNYVFLNCGRADGELRVSVYGYEPYRMTIRYEGLDSRMPTKEAFLIPSESASGGQPVITFSGKLPGITEIQAVSPGHAGCCISGFDERKRIMKLFKTHRLGMDDIFYGLVHPQQQTYEPFEVVKELQDGSVKISRPLAEAFTVNAPVARIVFGSVSEDGSYLLRVRDDAENLVYLVRYVAEGKAAFRTVDFHRAGERKLEQEESVWDNL
ncbi:MAG: hypothetical protein LIO86_04195 [Lachnospiraceae bacterium]|nr:hypothetical protein [Lachnospiraceae bacterium]